MREDIQSDHIGGAKSGALGAADAGAGECIYQVEAEVVLLCVMHRRQHGKYADTVSDEVGRILGANHAFA